MKNKIKDARRILLSVGETLAAMRATIDELSDEELNTKEAEELIEKERQLTELFEHYRVELDRISRVNPDDKEAMAKAEVALDVIFTQLTEGVKKEDYTFDADKAKRVIKEAVSKVEVDSEEEAKKEEPKISSSNEDMAKALSAGYDAPAKTTGSEKMAKELAQGNDKKEEKPLTSSQQAYKSILEDRIREVEEKLVRLEKLSKYDLTGHTATLIMGYRIELEKIKASTKNLDKREKLDKESEAKIAEIDKAQEALNEDQQALAEEKKSLEQQQKEVTGYWKKRRIARQIKHNERESQLMNVRRVEMREQQKAIMYPKQKVALKRQALISRQEGKVANIVENIEINNTDMEQMLAKDTLFSGIAAAHYDRVGNRYRKKLERSQAILEEMQKADTLKQIRGARRTVLSREYSDRLGNEMNPAMSQGVSI